MTTHYYRSPTYRKSPNDRYGNNVPVHHGWNSDFESVVKGLGEESRAYAWMNRETGTERKRNDDLCDIAAMSLTSIAVLIQTITSFADGNLLVILHIVGPILTALASIILGIRKHYSWHLVYPLNDLMYKKFTILANDCAMVLKLRRNHRPYTGSIFTEKVNKKYTKLMQSEENNILDKYRKQFIKAYGNTGVQVPGRIQEIVVSKESPKSDDSKTSSGETKSNRKRGRFPQIVREMLRRNTIQAQTPKIVEEDSDLEGSASASSGDAVIIKNRFKMDKSALSIPSPFTTEANQQAEFLMRRRCNSDLMNNSDSDYELTNEELMHEMRTELSEQKTVDRSMIDEEDFTREDNIEDHEVIDILDERNEINIHNNTPQDSESSPKSETYLKKPSFLSVNLKKILEQRKNNDTRSSL